MIPMATLISQNTFTCTCLMEGPFSCEGANFKVVHWGIRLVLCVVNIYFALLNSSTLNMRMTEEQLKRIRKGM